MKKLLFIIPLLWAGASAQIQVEDLGVITDRNAIILSRDPPRKDYAGYMIEFLPQFAPTNKVTLYITNEMILLENLVAVPHGPAIVGIRSVCKDGSESPVSLYTLDIRRDAPHPPNARMIGRITPQTHQTVEDVVENYRRRGILIPPAPPGAEGMDTNRIPEPGPEVGSPGPPGSPDARPIPARMSRPQTSLAPGQPLPNGTNETYSDVIDRMRRYYADNGKRRSAR